MNDPNKEIYKKNVSWYILGSILTKGITFFLIPFYANTLTVEEFGLLATFESLARLIPLIFSLCLDAAFIRFYYDEKNKSDKSVQKLFSTFFFTICTFGVILALISILFICIVKTPIDVRYIPPTIMVMCYSFFTQLSLMVVLIWKAEVAAKKITTFNFAVAISGFLLTISFLLVADFGWMSRLYALAIIAFIQTLIMVRVAIVNKWLILAFKKELLIEGLKFSLPLFPGQISFWVVSFSDRLILTHFSFEAEVGLYSLAAQLALAVYIIQDALTQINTPLFMKGYAENGTKVKNDQAKFLINLTLIMLVVYLGVVSFGREIIYLIASPDYHDAYKVLFLVCLAPMFRGWYRVFAVVLSYNKAVWVLSLSAIFQGIISVILNLTLIPKFGMYGAAISVCLSVALYFAIVATWAQYIDFIAIDVKLCSSLFVFLIITIVFTNFINENFSVGVDLLLIKCGFFMLSILSLIKISGNGQKALRFLRFKNEG